MERLRRRQRLTRRPDFLAVQERGRVVRGASYLLFALARDGAGAPGCRIGITVSRKVGGAVIRNRVKRWVRESARRMGDAVPRATDLVVVARARAANAGLAGTVAELAALLGRLGPG